MKTPADEPFHDALCRPGTGRPSGLPDALLSGLVDARDCPPSELGRLIRHQDPGMRHLGLVLLTERAAACRPSDDGELAEIAGLLPASPPGPPEADLLLAGLYERLGHRLRDRPWPSWRAAGLPARVRIAWLRAEIRHDPTAIRDETPGEPLYQAVRETDITGAHRPARLVDELADSGDPVLQAEALRLARQGLHAGLLAPTPVRESLTRLLGAESAQVVAGALDELAEPWAVTEPLPPGRLAPFLAADAVGERPAVADAALAAAARHGHKDLLRQVVEDLGLPPGLRRRGMELLGGPADREDIGELTVVAARDPLLFGGPMVSCLRGLHRRGHFAEDPHVPAVIGLALSDHSIPPRDVATVL
ncbi:hypothetical protein ACF08M_14660 [Streptomyces sp. NPDC015032]|uniref:hypothetical protein n=1 Tax=Streptomyces sp. NPDC015032 TaxID=3364937 RepID=UPI0036F7938C